MGEKPRRQKAPYSIEAPGRQSDSSDNRNLVLQSPKEKIIANQPTENIIIMPPFTVHRNACLIKFESDNPRHLVKAERGRARSESLTS